MDLEQVLELSPSSRVRAGDMGDLGDSDVAVLLSSSPLVAGMPRDRVPREQRAGRGRVRRRARLRLARRRHRRHEPGRSPRDARAGADRPGPAADPRLHAQRQPATADRHLAGPRRSRRGASRPGSIGEHGDLSVPLYGRVEVRGAPVRLTPEQIAVADSYRRTWYPRHVALDSGRSSTWTSGLGVARMIAALGGDGELWPASIVLAGEYGIHGVAVSVPATIAARRRRAHSRVGAQPGRAHSPARVGRVRACRGRRDLGVTGRSRRRSPGVIRPRGSGPQPSRRS